MGGGGGERERERKRTLSYLPVESTFFQGSRSIRVILCKEEALHIVHSGLLEGVKIVYNCIDSALTMSILHKNGFYYLTSHVSLNVLDDFMHNVVVKVIVKSIRPN